MSDTFISRIDGTIKNKLDYQNLDLSGLPNLFATDQELKDAKTIEFTIKSLGSVWNIDEDLLLKVACYFVSIDDSANFIDILNAEGWDIDAAWNAFARADDGPNPFLMEMSVFASETKGYRDYIKHKYIN